MVAPPPPGMNRGVTGAGNQPPTGMVAPPPPPLGNPAGMVVKGNVPPAGMVAPPPPPQFVYKDSKSEVSDISNPTVFDEIEFKRVPSGDVRNRGFSKFGADGDDDNLFSVNNPNSRFTDVSEYTDLDEDVPIPINIGMVVGSHGAPIGMVAPGPPPLSHKSINNLNSSNNKFPCNDNGVPTEIRPKSNNSNTSPRNPTKSVGFANPSQNRGASPPRTNRTGTTRTNRTGTTRSKRTKTDLSEQPSVADYTESSITNDRVNEGRFWQCVGVGLLLLALVSFSVSVYTTNNDLVNKKADRLVRSKVDMVGLCTTKTGEWCSQDSDKFVFNYGNLNTPKYNKIYLFNVINPSVVINGGKPVLEERGPYVFKEMTIRSDVVISDDKATVSYAALVKQIYIPDSGYLVTLDDKISMPNRDYVIQMSKAEGYGLYGLDYLSLKGTGTILEGIKEFYTLKTGGRNNNANSWKETYYMADSLWRKFFADVVLDLYKDALETSWSSSRQIDTYRDFLKRWGGDCTSMYCLSTGGTSSLLTLLDPGFCPSIVSSQTDKCYFGSDNLYYIDNAEDLWSSYDEFSFMAGTFDRVLDYRTGEPMGSALWFDENNQYQDRLQTVYLDTVLTDSKYRVVREWLYRIRDNYRYHEKLTTFFNQWIGRSVGDSPLDYRNTAVMQWATGKVLGRGNVRSFYDSQEFNQDVRAADGTKVGRWEYKDDGTNVKFNEFGVWAKRYKGIDVNISVEQARNLIHFLGDPNDVTKFWSLYGGPALLTDDQEVPGTGQTVKFVKEYVDYIKQTFVMPDFNGITSGEGSLLPSRTAGEWIQGFWEPVNKMFMDPGEPRQIHSMLGHQDYDHPYEPEGVVDSTDDIDDIVRLLEGNDGSLDDEAVATSRRLAEGDEEDEEEEIIYPKPMCTSSTDRTEPYADVFDMCTYDESKAVWFKKSDTFLTGLITTDAMAEMNVDYINTKMKMEMVEFRGYSTLPNEITGGTGEPLNLATAAVDLIGKGKTTQIGISGGKWFPPLNTIGACKAKDCDVAMLHADTQTPLIFRVYNDMVSYQGLGCKQLLLHDSYLIKDAGGLAFSYHDDYEFISTEYPGLIDITRQMGTPMYMSMPHFYSEDNTASERYGRDFVGLKPEKSLHQSKMLVEYATGLAVSKNIRLQYNILLPPKEGMFDNSMGTGEDALIFPLYWHEVSEHITEANANSLKMPAIYAMYWIEFTLIPVSIIFTMVMVGSGLCLIRRGGWMTVNASGRINEAGLRFHKQQADMADAKRKKSIAVARARQDRMALEKRIQSVGISKSNSEEFRGQNGANPMHGGVRFHDEL
jgi:hypothetical protein